MLPRLIVIADRFTIPHVARRVLVAARAGAPWILLRDREADERRVADAATEQVRRLRALEPSPLLSMVAYPTIAHSLHLNLHVGSHDVSPDDARHTLPSTTLIGYSAHEIEEVSEWAAYVDYFFFSPVYQTTHRPGVTPQGLDALRESVDAAGDRPVYALGGVHPDQVPDCLEAGAHGVAILSGILGAHDVGHAVQEYLRFLP